MNRCFAGSRWITILSALMITLTMSCGKSSGGGGNSDPALQVTLTPPAGSTQTAAPASGTFRVNVKITSSLPSKGVTISVFANPDGSNTSFFSSTKSSTSASNDFTITNTPVGQVCVVTVTVTSNNSSSNKYTGSYRYSAK